MIHHAFSMIDWVVLGAYFVVMMLIGAVYRSGREGIFDFFFARGEMPWWAVGLSLIATSVSASTFLGIPAEAYQFDLRLLQLNVGVPISIVLVCAVFIPFFRSSGATSAYEVLERRFDLKTRSIASILYIVHVLLRTGILIFGPSIMVSRLTGIDIRLIIVVVGISTIVYTAMGGIRAVIWTDVIQFFIFVAGAVLICLYVSLDVPGGTPAILHAADAVGKLRWFDGSWGLANPRNIWAAGFAYIALDLAIRATDQQFVQRYLCCADIAGSRLAAILSAVVGLFISILFFAVGVYLWVYYQAYPAALGNITDVNLVLPNYIASKLPLGVAGLLVAAIFAAAMSSISSAINALSNTATIDFYKRFGGAPERNLLFARAMTVVWGVLGIGFALYAASFGMNILELALSFTSLFTGALLGIFLLAVAVPRASGWGAFVGCIAGMAALAIATQGMHLPISWPWYPVISSATTVIVGWLVSFVAPRRAIALALCLSVAPFFAGCAKDLVTGKTTLNYFSLESEPQLGSQVLAAQKKSFVGKGKKMDAEADPVEYERLKRIVARLGAVSHYPGFPYEVHLADVDVVNAWCAPGGKVMVYTGLWNPKKGLVEKGNDDQLAAVLSHEIAHANARHITKAISREMTLATVGAVVQTAIAAGGSVEGANVFGDVFMSGMDLYIPSYSRKNELEADRLGLFYMAKAGYDPRAAVELWKKAAKRKKERATIFASHPVSGARARALEQYLPQAMVLYEEARAAGVGEERSAGRPEPRKARPR
jgi:solute:Na+ symporter, SSS family